MAGAPQRHAATPAEQEAARRELEWQRIQAKALAAALGGQELGLPAEPQEVAPALPTARLPGPLSGGSWQDWWEGSLTKNLLLDPVVSGATLPGDVYAGRIDPRSDEAIERAADFAGMIPVSGLVAGARGLGAVDELYGGVIAPQQASDDLTLAMEAAVKELMGGKEPPAAGVHPHQYYSDVMFDPTLSDEVTNLFDQLDSVSPSLAKYWAENFKDLPDHSKDWLEEALQSPQGMEAVLGPALAKKGPYDPTKQPAPPLPAWMAQPAVPTQQKDYGAILGPHHADWDQARKGLFEAGLTADYLQPLLENPGVASPENIARTAEIQDVLTSLKGRGRRSKVVPWAIQTDSPRFGSTSTWDEDLGEYVAGLGGRWQDTVPQEFPADPAVRERAQDMGFDIDQILWRSSKYPVNSFIDPKTKSSEPMLFLGDDPQQLTDYGKYLYPLVARMENPLVRDAQGEQWGGWMNTWIEEALAGGHDSMVVQNMRDLAGGTSSSLQNQYLVRSPEQLRSIYAQFDPSRRDDPYLLAAELLGVNPPGVLDERERRR